jgi:hypothetical protein
MVLHIINGRSRGVEFNADHYIPDVAIPLAEWRKSQVGRTDRTLIVHADNSQPHTATMSLDFLEQNGMKKHLTHRSHLIWHRLISISSLTLNSSQQDMNPLIGVHFLTQSKTF